VKIDVVAARYALESTLLPLLHDALPFAEQVRRALIRNRVDTSHSEAITGKQAGGLRLKDTNTLTTSLPTKITTVESITSPSMRREALMMPTRSARVAQNYLSFGESARSQNGADRAWGTRAALAGFYLCRSATVEICHSVLAAALPKSRRR